MPTYAQLQSEPWWGREIITPELAWFGDQLCNALGVPRNHFGAKGDNAHLNGGHRSQEWIKNSRYCTNRTYTTVSGLTADQARHIAAFDITPRTRDQMLTISRNLDKVCRAGQLEEIVEWYGNTNNDQRVDGWNNIKNAVATSDSSHLWHLHGTFDRRVLRDRSVMQRTLTALTHGTTQGDDMTPEQSSQLLNLYNALFSGGTSMGTPVPSKVNPGSTGNALVDLIQHIRTKVDAATAVDTTKIASALAADQTFVNSLAAAVAAQVNKSGGATAEQVRTIVDEELDEAFRGGADNDTPTAG